MVPFGCACRFTTVLPPLGPLGEGRMDRDSGVIVSAYPPLENNDDDSA